MAAPTHVTIPGLAAHSTFRLEELQKNANAVLSAKGVDAKVERVRSLFVHYVCPEQQEESRLSALEDTSSAQRKTLGRLLQYGDEHSALNNDPFTEQLIDAAAGGATPEQTDKDVLVWITPRKGTISPWSSKATSIAHVCDLGKYVSRIERGLLLSITFDRPFNASASGLPFADIIYDRMTEV